MQVHAFHSIESTSGSDGSKWGRMLPLCRGGARTFSAWANDVPTQPAFRQAGDHGGSLSSPARTAPERRWKVIGRARSARQGRACRGYLIRRQRTLEAQPELMVDFAPGIGKAIISLLIFNPR